MTWFLDHPIFGCINFWMHHFLMHQNFDASIFWCIKFRCINFWNHHFWNHHFWNHQFLEGSRIMVSGRDAWVLAGAWWCKCNTCLNMGMCYRCLWCRHLGPVETCQKGVDPNDMIFGPSNFWMHQFLDASIFDASIFDASIFDAWKNWCINFWCINFLDHPIFGTIIFWTTDFQGWADLMGLGPFMRGYG